MLFQFNKNNSYLSGKSNIAKCRNHFSQVPQPPKSVAIFFIKKIHRIFSKTAISNWICYCFLLKNTKLEDSKVILSFFVPFHSL